MVRYRYRTPALTGPWRETEDQALADAARARQARAEGSGGASYRWIVPGRIETDQAGC